MSDFGGSSRPETDGNTIALIDAVFRWCEALKQHAGIIKALSAIAAGLGAEAMSVSRVWKAGRGASKYLVYDRTPASSRLPRVNRSFASAILGEYMSIARNGTVWLQSTVEMEASPELTLFQSRRSIRELAIIPLETGDNSSDFLEIFFLEPLTPKQHALLNSLAQTLGEAWRVRTKGVFVASVVDSIDVSNGNTGFDMLSPENPAQLSRSEFRVCLLLSKGKSVQSVCSELSVSRSTLQTHLRNIYAKTSTHSLADLLYILLKTADHSNWAGLGRIA